MGANLITEGSATCKFLIAWIGLCKKPASVNGFCEEHSKEKCSSCGEQATHSCYETMGLVCGAPLCDNCEHTICENGCNSGAKLPDGYKWHCKKDAQQINYMNKKNEAAN